MEVAFLIVVEESVVDAAAQRNGEGAHLVLVDPLKGHVLINLLHSLPMAMLLNHPGKGIKRTVMYKIIKRKENRICLLYNGLIHLVAKYIYTLCMKKMLNIYIYSFCWIISQGGYGGSNNAYGGQQQPQQQSVGYGSSGGSYGSQGYTQSYQGYESYQQPDYAQTSVSELKIIQ